MPTFTASQPLDMRIFFGETDVEPEIDYIATSTSLTIVKASSTFIARGVGFTYDSEESFTGGSIQEMEESRGGSPAWSLTDASYSPVTIESFYGSNDVLDLAGLNAYLFAAGDAITGSTGADWLGGYGGNDTIDGRGGSDTLNGGAGADTMRGGNGNDVYIVNAAADRAVEASGAGTDTVQSTAPSYTLGANVERLTLTGGADIGGSGNGLDNVIRGNGGANLLRGQGGNDSLAGGGGNDTLSGGAGNDTLAGAAGADAFRFEFALSGANVDVLTDFDAVADRIDLDDAVFTALGAAGALAATAFRAGTAATTAAHRIVYDQASGTLSYDADGSGAGAAVVIAQLGPGTALSASDIFIV